MKRKYRVEIVWIRDYHEYIETNLKKEELLKLCQEYVKKPGNVPPSAEDFVDFLKKKGYTAKLEEPDYTLTFDEIEPDRWSR